MANALPYKPKPGEIPTQPGVYRFRDAEGRVLYVGKAKNLRARLSNYFAPLHTLHERTRRMVTTATSVEWTVVGSDVESLQLEYMWIQEFSPPFNVRYKDDKSYPYMAITLADEAPRVIVTRNRRIPGARYFGPYPKIWAVHDTIDLMIKVFPIRTCSDASYKKAMATGRPCFPGQIGRCGGPCSMKVTVEEHRAIVDDFVAFMSGGDARFTRELTARMREASAAMDYESAAVYRDRLQAIDAVLSRSALVLPSDTDADLFGIAEDELSAAVQHFVVRGGRVRGVRATTIDKELDISGADLVDQVLQRTYGGAGAGEIPRQVLVPELPGDAADLEEWLQERRGKRVSIQVAQRGAKADLLRTATINAQQALMLHKTRRTSDYTSRTKALTDLQLALGLDEAPLRIECYDVSHLSGTNVVASMVVFEDGLPRKDQYRSFGVPETTDDTDSLYQVLMRRLAHVDRDDPAEVVAAEVVAAEVVEAVEAVEVAAAVEAEAVEAVEEPVVTERKRPRFALPPAAARRRRRRAAGGGGGARPRRLRAHRDRPVRHREAAGGDLAAGGGVPRHPAPHLRGAVPAAAAARRGAPVRDHAPAQAAQARHHHGARRGARPRRGAHQGAAEALRVGRRPQPRERGRDHRPPRHRPEARRRDRAASRQSVGCARALSRRAESTAEPRERREHWGG